MLIGYACVSALDQDSTLQTAALKAAGCSRTFEETASGAAANRPQLAAARAGQPPWSAHEASSMSATPQPSAAHRPHSQRLLVA